VSHIPFSSLRLVSSNPRKLREFAAFGIDDLIIEEGRDLAEVLGTPDQVIVHKAIAAGADRIVEDSILIVGDQTIVDARYRIGEVDTWAGIDAVWEVRIGVNIDGKVLVYKGAVSGMFGPARGEGQDYDPYFHIPNEGKSLAELNSEGRKADFSARFRAIQALVRNDAYASFRVADISDWAGAYQH
jgi:inosine/xanthosine triphosphate pyrophosphatase family protein